MAVKGQADLEQDEFIFKCLFLTAANTLVARSMSYKIGTLVPTPRTSNLLNVDIMMSENKSQNI